MAISILSSLADSFTGAVPSVIGENIPPTAFEYSRSSTNDDDDIDVDAENDEDGLRDTDRALLRPRLSDGSKFIPSLLDRAGVDIRTSAPSSYPASIATSFESTVVVVVVIVVLIDGMPPAPKTTSPSADVST